MTRAVRPAVVDRADDLTAEWLSAALSAGGPQVEVVDVAAERFGTGQMGTAHRLTLRYGAGAAGPERLVAKLAADDPAARAVVAEGYRKEVGFYSELASTVAVRRPRCWYAAIDGDGTSFTLLLDDVSPARPGVQALGCTVAEASEAVRNLAGLHAPRWDDPTLEDVAFLQRVDRDVADFIGSLHVDATGQFVDRFAGVLAAEDVATLRAAAASTADWLVARPSPVTVTHGDYRLDNLLFHPDGGVTAVDWQTTSLGPPLRDVAYFLGTSLDVELRRAHEGALVRTYHEELLARGVGGYDLARCLDDYRLGHLHGPLVTVLGSEFATAVRTSEADEMFLAMATRSCAAIRDHGTLDLVARAPD